MLVADMAVHVVSAGHALRAPFNRAVESSLWVLLAGFASAVLARMVSLKIFGEVFTFLDLCPADVAYVRFFVCFCVCAVCVSHVSQCISLNSLQVALSWERSSACWAVVSVG
jgi:hypothetical protein